MYDDKLVVVWLSTDKRAALDMAMLYARDSLLSGWFREAELILWGPSVATAVNSAELRTEFEILHSVGVRLSACLSCARLYGVVEQLTQLGIIVAPMGEQLTDYLKGRASVMFI